MFANNILCSIALKGHLKSLTLGQNFATKKALATGWSKYLKKCDLKNYEVQGHLGGPVG